MSELKRNLVKKVGVSALGMAVVVSLVGCSESSTGESEEAGVSSENVLRVGMDLKYPPFTYIGDDGNPAGLEVDIANAFGESIGMEIEIVETDFAMLIPALDTGDIDIVICEMSVKEERLEKVDFSNPYLFSSFI